MNTLQPRRLGLLATIAGVIVRALTFSEPEAFQAGVEFTSDAPIEQSFPVVASMAALGKFPWIRACVLAKADDIAGLDVHVMRDGKVVENHPLNAILNQPASKTTWFVWVRQAVVDYELSGNHYSLIQSESLLRMHPQDVNAVAEDSAQIQGFTYREDGRSFDWEDVLHVKNVSWMRGQEELIGEGSVRSLSADLTVEISGKKMAAKIAKRGRLEGIFSPDASADLAAWGKKQVSDMRTKISEWSTKANGYLILGGPVKFTPVTPTPADMQIAEHSVATRDATLAVFSVPPVRVGLETANYATARQQSKTYWEGLINGPISALEDGLTWLAVRMGKPGDTVAFDTSGVEALQEAMSVRLERVSTHILNGMTPEAAYLFEGIETPVGAFVAFVPAPAPEPAPPAADPEEDERRFRAAPRTEQERADRWRHFIKRIHNPAVLRLNLAVSRYLAAAALRYNERLEEVAGRAGFERAGEVVQRGLTDGQLAEVLAESQEVAAALEALRPAMRAAILDAFRANAARIGTELTWNEANSGLAQMSVEAVTRITTMQGAVVESIAGGLDAGLTINELQAQLMQSRAFSPARSLRIARTEATRLSNAGATEAITAASDEGIVVQKQWLTARDTNVRPSHVQLDGDTVDHGEQFATGSHHASYPGGFGVPGEDINCRCTVIPVLGEQS